jgi:hypothetical protein
MGPPFWYLKGVPFQIVSLRMYEAEVSDAQRGRVAVVPAGSMSPGTTMAL